MFVIEVQPKMKKKTCEGVKQKRLKMTKNQSKSNLKSEFYKNCVDQPVSFLKLAVFYQQKHCCEE